MKSSRPQLADAGFALAVLIFLGAGILSYFSGLQLSEVRTSATRSFQILETVARLDSIVSQVSEESLQSAAKPDRKYAAVFEQYTAIKNRCVDRLRSLTDGDSEQQSRLSRAEALITRSFIEAARSMLNDPQAAAPQPGQENQMASYLGPIRDVLEEMNKSETAALEASLKQEVESGVFSRKITAAGTVGGLFIMVFVFLMLKRDISARQRAEEALTTQHELLSGLISHIPESVYVKDAEGRFTMANYACRQRLTGSKNGTVVGKTIYDFLTPRSAQEVDLDDQAVIRARRPFINRVKRTQNVKGEYSWQKTTKVPLFDGAGNLTDLLAIESDVSEEMKEQEAAPKNSPVLAPSSELLAVTSAEYRSPDLIVIPEEEPPAAAQTSTLAPQAVKPLTEKEIEPPSPRTDFTEVVISSFEEIEEMIGSADYAKMLINVFLDETPKTMKELEEAVAAGDQTGIERTAHALKGSLGNFGAKTAMDLAHALEFNEENGEEELGKKFEEFRAELLRVMHALARYV